MVMDAGDALYKAETLLEAGFVGQATCSEPWGWDVEGAPTGGARERRAGRRTFCRWSSCDTRWLALRPDETYV